MILHNDEFHSAFKINVTQNITILNTIFFLHSFELGSFYVHKTVLVLQ